MIDDVPAPLPSTSHIFIVGLSRTGTSLTRAVLNANPLIAIASGESHYFDAVRPRRTKDGADAVARLLEIVDRPSGSRFWTVVAERADRRMLEARLRSSAQPDRELFDYAMEVHAAGRPIRGEKTPHHVNAVPTLFDWFPDARVIHTLRDPRAVYVSLRRKEGDWTERAQTRGWASRQVRRLGPLGDGVITTKLISDFRHVVRLHRSYERRYPERYRLLQFEHLISEPAAEVRGLCDFIGVDYADAMLEQVVRNSSFVAAGSSGFDQSAADRWRSHLSLRSQRWFSLLCGRQMAEFGYRP